MRKDELIFVYNADSGKWNLYMDIAHKIISPKTYPCHLCDITYGVFKIREEWKAFKEWTNLPMRFLHRDEWLSEFGMERELPAIFLHRNGEIQEWVPAGEMNKMNLEDLIEKLEAFELSYPKPPVDTRLSDT